MVDELEEKPGERPNLQQYISVIRRRYLLFLISFFLGWLVFWSASWVLPVRYTWGTQIRVPTAYAPPNVNDDLQGRLEKVSQQILSSTPLLHIVDQLNLYAKERGRLTPDELAERMRDDIKVEQVRSDERRITSVNIYYSAHDPHVARQVTGELTNLFISEDERMRIQESEDNTKFLEEQLGTSHQNLVEQEAKIRVFKDQHPELGSNLQILAGLRSELRDLEDAAPQPNANVLEPPVTPKPGDGTPTRLLALEEELDKLRAQLDDLRSRGYTDLYPEVRKLNEQIAQKEKSLADLKAAAPPPNVDGRDAPATIPHEGKLKANQAEIAERKRIAALKAKIKDYQERLHQEPVLEQQYADLTRGYDQLKAHYDDLLNKKVASEMATAQLRNYPGKLLLTIDLTRLPLKHDFPNRIKLCVIGLGVGLALGTLLTWGAEYLDDRIYNEKSLKELLPVTVVSVIPAITTKDDKRRQQRRLRLTWVLIGFVFATILAGSAISFLWG